jgi:NAD(P)H dehydrogenase (quinone)
MIKKFIILFLFILNFLPLAAQDTTHVLIVYFSKTGHTKRMAENVAKGAGSIGNVSVKLLAVDKASNKDVLQADAIILGSPVYNANVAPPLQSFINNWPFQGAPLKDKIGAVFVSAGGISTGEEIVQLNVLHSMLVFGMVIVGGGNWQSAFGASAITGEAPFDTKGQSSEMDEQFLLKAEMLGKRVAEIAKKLKREN